ncbi:MAG TPA: cbb3-type cytochrome oxidase assembly protein CcoS [Chitinophagales bacterium]|nr:cbb3-type cytochrome oxidase assembly protein CcoS [Chitinophagales bacterium]
MTALILLIACSLIVAVAFLAGFLWSVKNGQYDDTYTPSIRMLFEHELKARQKDHDDTTPSNNQLSNHPPKPHFTRESADATGTLRLRQ